MTQFSVLNDAALAPTQLLSADPADWPVAPLYLDVQFTKMGELTLSTATVTIFCVKDITHA